MDVKSCDPCAIASWYCRIQHGFCLVMAQRHQLVRKDNQIRFFSQIFECDTLTLWSIARQNGQNWIKLGFRGQIYRPLTIFKSLIYIYSQKH